MSTEATYTLNALPDRNTRGAFSVFCDDVREETSGKLIYIGVYGQDVFVPSFPALLPTLTVMTWAWTSLENPFQKLVFRTILDDQVLTAEQIDPVAATAGDDSSQNNLADTPSALVRQHFTRTIRFSPFVVERESILRVRVETEDGELRTSALRFKLAAPSQQG